MDKDGPVWTLRDAAIEEFPPTFPELAVHVVITDGCGCQVKFLSSIHLLLLIHSRALLLGVMSLHTSKGVGLTEGSLRAGLGQQR